MISYNKIEALKQPTLHCGKCGVAVFRLPVDVRKEEMISDTILRSEPIPPQLKPMRKEVAKCSSCGVQWAALSESVLVLKEGVMGG
ncbi:hypothetical protein DFQ01_12175 [Paenibacillus cellulosilyticus]|uniref:Uncharacterized protein n=2 Tax=Paenibacillus cellulosilyticus TaxID=375489 RepID=A0A2V2YNN7_9BACL|nr:hypothetical protein DFQ01_12175 [Paenibacillus cellulosilyticus]